MNFDFTEDTVLNGAVKIFQPVKGFRFGTDSVLLSKFIGKKRCARVLEIGAGSGVISAILHKAYGFELIDAVEYQKNMYDCLVKTVNENGFNGKINPVFSDIKDFKPHRHYDMIVSNPPYRKRFTGKASTEDTKNIARFDNELTIDDIFAFGKSYLRTLGFLFLSLDADMAQEIFSKAKDYNLELKRLRFLHPDIDKPAKIVFVELRKNAGRELKVEPPFFQRINGQINQNYDSIDHEDIDCGR